MFLSHLDNVNQNYWLNWIIWDWADIEVNSLHLCVLQGEPQTADNAGQWKEKSRKHALTATEKYILKMDASISNCMDLFTVQHQLVNWLKRRKYLNKRNAKKITESSMFQTSKLRLYQWIITIIKHPRRFFFSRQCEYTKVHFFRESFYRTFQ